MQRRPTGRGPCARSETAVDPNQAPNTGCEKCSLSQIAHFIVRQGQGRCPVRRRIEVHGAVGASEGREAAIQPRVWASLERNRPSNG